MQEAIESGAKSIALNFGDGLNMSLSVSDGAMKDTAIAALNGTNFSIEGDGNVIVGGQNFSQNGFNRPYTITSSSWTLWDSPKTDDALAAAGYDQSLLYTDDGGKLTFDLRNPSSATARLLTENGSSVFYDLDQDSKDYLSELKNSGRTINNGETIGVIKFINGNSMFSMSVTARRDASASSFFAMETFTAEFSGLHEGVNIANPRLKGIDDGNVVVIEPDEPIIPEEPVTPIKPEEPEDPAEPTEPSEPKESNYKTDNNSKAEKRLWIHTGQDATDGMYIAIGGISTRSLGINGINVGTEDGALDAISRIDTALSTVSGIRSKIGAQQNRLEHTINNVSNISENLTASESRIRDTDVSEEVVAYVKHNLLENAGTSMMAQANHSSDSVMNLLNS